MFLQITKSSIVAALAPYGMSKQTAGYGVVITISAAKHSFDPDIPRDHRQVCIFFNDNSHNTLKTLFISDVYILRMVLSTTGRELSTETRRNAGRHRQEHPDDESGTGCGRIHGQRRLFPERTWSHSNHRWIFEDFITFYSIDVFSVDFGRHFGNIVISNICNAFKIKFL